MDITPKQKELLFKAECYSIQGVIFEVYKQMGCGFLESIYSDCLKFEFESQHIPFIYQRNLKLYYKEHILEHTFKPDFICFNKIIIEIKATRCLTVEHSAQIINYLKASNLHLGLLINFGSYPKATIQRYIN